MKEFLRIVGSRIALLIVGWLIAGGAGSIKVNAMAEVPPADMLCDKGTTPFSPAWTYVDCTFPPFISKFVTRNAAWEFKSAYLLPNPLPVTKSLKFKAHFDGYSAVLAGPNGCTSYDHSQAGYIVSRNCPGHYPRLDLYPGSPLDWGGIFNGEKAYGWRIAAMFTRANERWGSSIDWGAGITLEGSSYGGTTAILQSVILPDRLWRRQISIVNAHVPQTLFVSPNGGYWRDPAVRLAWGSYDTNKADIVKRANKVRHIYYRVNGSPADTAVVFDLDFFRQVCDQRKIACFGTWHDTGHNLTEPGVNLPFLSLYSGPDMQVRLDTLLPVFTNSTANYWGRRGHYNLGLEWANVSQPFIDTKNRVVVPVRYLRHTNLGGDIPDQPLTATFDLTITRPTKFTLPVGQLVNWSLGEQSGQLTVTKAGEVTVLQITLDSSSEYTSLYLTKGDQ